jgi:uncharacterized protein YbbK (DUF523 family)
MHMEKILVSACLLGEKVRYHGGDAASDHPILRRWRAEGRLVVACPERDGGLPTPRPAAEVVGGDGHAVVARLAMVTASDGADVTGAFRQGAEVALQLVRRHRIRVAVLKDGSPSCGSASIYDGTFSGTRVANRGVTSALLESHGVRVFSEAAIEAAHAWLEALTAESMRGSPNG